MSGEDEKAQVESPEAEASSGESKSEPQADDQNEKVANGGEKDGKKATKRKAASNKKVPVKEDSEAEEEDKAKDSKKKKAPQPKKSPAKKTKKKDSSDEEDEEKEETKPKKPVKKPASPKKGSKEAVADEEEDDDEGEEEQSEKGVPLLDQPLEVSGSRERKKVARFEYSNAEKDEKKPFVVPEGKGTELGKIPLIENLISKFKVDNIKPVTKALFGSRGPVKAVMKKYIRSFNGYDFDEESDQWEKRKILLTKAGTKQLKVTCEVLGLERSGTVPVLTERIMQFCLNPTDSGKKPPQPKSKRKSKGASRKRKTDSDSEAKPSKVSKRNKGKIVSLKDVSDSDSEEEKVKEDVKKVAKSKKAKAVESSDDEPEKDGSEKDESEKEESDKDEKDASDKDEKDGSDKEEKDASDKDEKDGSDKEEKDVSDEEEDKKKTKKTKKPAAKKAPVKPAKKAPKKAPAKKKVSESEDEASEDDEPLVKMAKVSPPTDEEIKTYVKKILEGANLEEITMKTVCKQVYENYPEHDLAHKKDLIKETVKSLISP